MTFKKDRSLSRQTQQSGFTLITSIFLLVVVALLSSYIVTLRSVQQTTVGYGVQGVRAMQAARAGIEWGIYRALPPEGGVSECSDTNEEFIGSGAIADFRIYVTCKLQGIHTEGIIKISTYRLTSRAEIGVYGTLNYTSRELQSRVSESP